VAIGLGGNTGFLTIAKRVGVPVVRDLTSVQAGPTIILGREVLQKIYRGGLKRVHSLTIDAANGGWGRPPRCRNRGNIYMRVNTGVMGFDELVQGGLVEKRSYLLTGPPGSGKTTFAMRYLESGAMKGETGLYVSFLEPPLNMVNDFSAYSSQIVNFVKQKRILFLDLTKIHLQDAFTYEVLLNKLEGTVQPNDIKRVVIDSLTVAILIARLPPEDRENALYSFLMAVNDLGSTNIILSELQEMDTYALEQFVVHGVIILHHFLQAGRMIRALQLLKMRGIKIDSDLRKIVFGRSGIEVSGGKLV